jgi:hypothetical protein
MFVEPFIKWCLDFIKPIKLARWFTWNWYILINIDYLTKWLKPKFYELILLWLLPSFGCLFHIVMDKGTHFGSIHNWGTQKECLTPKSLSRHYFEWPLNLWINLFGKFWFSLYIPYFLIKMVVFWMIWMVKTCP